MTYIWKHAFLRMKVFQKLKAIDSLGRASLFTNKNKGRLGPLTFLTGSYRIPCVILPSVIRPALFVPNNQVSLLFTLYRRSYSPRMYEPVLWCHPMLSVCHFGTQVVKACDIWTSLQRETNPKKQSLWKSHLDQNRAQEDERGEEIGFIKPTFARRLR